MNSLAGNGLVVTSLNLHHQFKNPRPHQLDGERVLILRVKLLHKDVTWVGNGSRIPDWIG